MLDEKLFFEKAAKIKLFASDVDGVLTKGEIIVLDNGEEIKIWNVKDGFGYSLLRKHFPEVKTAWITGRKSKQVKKRARELKIDFLLQDIDDKKEALLSIMKAIKCAACEVVFVGDDLPDIAAFEAAGLSVCPKDAVKCVKNRVDFISHYNGGEGVIRETADIIIEAKKEAKNL
ncbi:MAG: HAD hydrolase family protein [Elusimicrobiota bacterium]|jgi:3-deoxy-D-manno-octulosonate 8-phosphate phosphatase (KDO 8-P phosphatase)|nr:HAD hydrolase family protein [Elusimicrobiota bacterium]